MDRLMWTANMRCCWRLSQVDGVRRGMGGTVTPVEGAVTAAMGGMAVGAEETGLTGTVTPALEAPGAEWTLRAFL